MIWQFENKTNLHLSLFPGPGQRRQEEQAVKEGGLRVECLEFILLFWSNCNLHFCIIMSSIEELKYKRLHIIKNADQKIQSYKEVKWSENWFSCSFANEGNAFSCGIAWLLDLNFWDLIKLSKARSWSEARSFKLESTISALQRVLSEQNLGVEVRFHPTRRFFGSFDKYENSLLIFAIKQTDVLLTSYQRFSKMLRSRGFKKIQHTQTWFSNFENFRLSPWNERGKKAWLTEGVCPIKLTTQSPYCCVVVIS